MGLEEDIEDLRAELIDELTAYEGRIGRLAGRLPRWLELPPGTIKSVFRFSDDTVEPDAMIGPRAVAMGAGRVEQFVHDWLGVDGKAADVQLDEQAREELADDYNSLLDYLQTLAKDARSTHEEADQTLNDWLDGVLSQLDMRRETDLDAVEQLIHEGEIGRGHSARQEMADLWEEQRLKADELRTAWRPLEEHLHEGLALTLSGIEELEELASRAGDGLIGANADLEEHLERDETRNRDDDQADEADVDVVPSVTEPIAAADSESAIDDVSDTQLDDEEVDDDEPPEPASTDHGAVELPSDSDELRVDEIASDTVPDVAGSSGIVPPDEPEQPELGSLESSSVNDYSEPVVDESPPTQPHADASRHDSHEPEKASESGTNASDPGVERRDESTEQADRDRPDPDSDAADESDDEASVSDLRAPEAAADARDDGRDAEAVELADANARAPADDHVEDDDRVEGHCFRIRDGYRRVGFLEVFFAAGLPLVFLLSIGAVALLEMTGAGGFDPFDRWGWMPAALVVAAAWTILVPAALRWRPKWLGWTPRIVRLDDVREESEIAITPDGIELGDDDWRWGQLRGAELARWDSPPDDMQGWVISVESPRQGRLEFASPEQNRETWKRSTFELVDAPYEAWQVDRRVFKALRQRIIGD
jgi:hypothetical protein